MYICKIGKRKTQSCDQEQVSSDNEAPVSPPGKWEAVVFAEGGGGIVGRRCFFSFSVARRLLNRLADSCRRTKTELLKDSELTPPLTQRVRLQLGELISVTEACCGDTAELCSRRE